MNEYEGIATTPFPPAALSVDEKSPVHSPNSADTRLSRFLGSGRMTGSTEIILWTKNRLLGQCPHFRQVQVGWEIVVAANPVLRALQEENDYFRIPDDAEVHQFTDGSGAQRGTSFMRTA
jgi:hypothetical protein